MRRQTLLHPKRLRRKLLLKIRISLNSKILHIKKERTKSAYFTSERETARLELQTRLLRKFDGEIYRQVFEEYEEPDILDVGCGNGSMIFDRMDGCCENFRLIGIERDPDKVQEAGDKFGGSQVAFITGDVEESDFIDDLADKMDEMGIEKFDIINISMLLLHLKSECALLRRLRRLLKPEGTVIIKDIDDGINFAYPDEENVFDENLPDL